MTDASDTRPAPLTPADCTLQDFPYMPLDVRRLLTSETWVLGTGDERSAVIGLLLESWHQVPAGSVPADDRWLAHKTGAGRRWRRIKESVLRDWVECSDGRLYHPMIAGRVLSAWTKKVRLMRRINRRLEMESGAWALIRSAVFERDDYTCRYCGVRGGRLEADHVIPVVDGGESVMGNLVTSCRPCNRAKGTKSLAEWRRA